MDAGSSMALRSTNFFCRISNFRSSSISKSNLTNHKLTLKSSSPSLSPRVSFSRLPCDLNRRKPRQISSVFRRPPPRRNTLREKLIIRKDDEVCNSPEVSFPTTNLEELIHANNEANNSELSHEYDDGESILRGRLDSWADQHKKDSEFWGIGSGPIFTIYQDIDGNVSRVLVNEEEIAKRIDVKQWSLEEEDNLEDEFVDVNSKIARAKVIAKEIECGEFRMPKYTSVAKFIVEEKKVSFVEGLKALPFMTKPFGNKFSHIGFFVLCSCCVVWAGRKLSVGSKKMELTREEAEMLRRKKKARMEKEELKRGSVEVLGKVEEVPIEIGRRPELNREKLLEKIAESKLTNQDSVVSGNYNEDSDFDVKVKEIRAMARKVKELERKEQSDSGDKAEAHDALSMMLAAKNPNFTAIHDAYAQSRSKYQSEHTSINEMNPHTNSEEKAEVCEHLEKKKIEVENNVEVAANSDIQGQADIKIVTCSSDSDSVEGLFKCDKNFKVQSESTALHEEKLDGSSPSPDNESQKGKLKVITSVEEARKFLGKKRSKSKGKQVTEKRLSRKSSSKMEVNTQKRNEITEAKQISELHELKHAGLTPVTSDVKPHENCAEINHSSLVNEEASLEGEVAKFQDHTPSKKLINNLNVIRAENVQSVNDHRTQRAERIEDKQNSLEDQTGIHDLNKSKLDSEPYDTFTSKSSLDVDNFGAIHSTKEFISTSCGTYISGEPYTSIQDTNVLAGSKKCNTQYSVGDKSLQQTKKELLAEKNWIEENFQEFDHVIRKIGLGFQENYMMAKDKVQEVPTLSSILDELKSSNQDGQLDWMNDGKLRDIVFKVRENELAGRDPFHLMVDDDKLLFFEGLEQIAEKENQKLLVLHEWIQSRIENLHYGADGVSIYDPPEKIFPRWKGPVIDKDPGFLRRAPEQSRTSPDLNSVVSTDATSDTDDLQSLEESPSGEMVSSNLDKKNSKSARTLIEGSDGSSRVGKRKGKEYWQHTKKWSQGFLDVYNSETDPEIKSIMKDMGKDLDKWITDKEIQDVAELLGKIPKRKRDYLEKKIDKLKREIHLYGQPAVISKYREYSDEKEEDYLWWLDLPFILCIELYTMEDGKQKVGFYSLEMAADLELDPKQYHVIAFEDPDDCKNFCYIVQTHLEMLDTGSAFVVARPPKDAFREAKADGFSITVIRKGELKLNIDQALEEVDEEIKDIGSKMYHDIIMRERSVDMSTLMKGVIAADKPTNRHKKVKKPAQPKAKAKAKTKTKAQVKDRA